MTNLLKLPLIVFLLAVAFADFGDSEPQRNTECFRFGEAFESMVSQESVKGHAQKPNDEVKLFEITELFKVQKLSPRAVAFLPKSSFSLHERVFLRTLSGKYSTKLICLYPFHEFG